MDETDIARREREKAARLAALPAVRLRHHARLVAPRDGDVWMHTSIGPAGELVVLWAPAEYVSALRAAMTQPGAPEPRTLRPVSARVTAHAPDMAVLARIPDLPVASYLFAQPLPDGRVLLVDSRCEWRPDGPDRNAIVYDADGAVRAEHIFGDGIQHVATTRRGEVWVGYFDEGVFGSAGWGNEDSEPPLGLHGLTRFSADLAPVWQYPSVGNQWGPISDCYALNVDGDTAWACYYTGFPIVRIHDNTVTGWRNDIGAVKALAVGGSRIALSGGYGANRDRLVVGVLDTDRFRVTGEYRLVAPDGQPLPALIHVLGHGPDLHVLVDNDWLRIGLDDLPADS